MKLSSLYPCISLIILSFSVGLYLPFSHSLVLFLSFSTLFFLYTWYYLFVCKLHLFYFSHSILLLTTFNIFDVSLKFSQAKMKSLFNSELIFKTSFLFYSSWRSVLSSFFSLHFLSFFIDSFYFSPNSLFLSPQVDFHSKTQNQSSHLKSFSVFYSFSPFFFSFLLS